MVLTESSTVTHPAAVGAEYAVPFQFFANSDLRVERLNGTTVTPLLEGTDYSVAGGDGETGTVTLSYLIVAPAQLRIRRVLAITQPLDLVEQQTLRVENIERALDRAVMILQQIADAAAGA